uniref:mitogen-activated protein kinase kinase n=4 Tax=Parascaris univalens TaxID=6257 RepID=A0A915BR55_PARUN
PHIAPMDIPLHQRIRDFESRIRRWKQVRFGPSSTHVFASRRSSSIEPRSSAVPRLNVGAPLPPRTSPLPRRAMANGQIPRRPLPELPTPISSVSSPSPSSNDEALDRRVAEIKSQSGRIVIMNVVYQASKDNLKRIGELGSGTCGVVYKARFDLTGTIMAVKQMAMTSVAEERRRVVMDLDVVLRSHDCPHIVRCYGCFISDYEVHICMELMATCLDKLSKRVQDGFPEDILGKMAVSIIKALDYLKVHQNIIHRDVKPSNILLDLNGTVKLCDFGIAGRLVDSLVRTHTAGCSAYMSPERLDPTHNYDIRADIWSVGISLVELARGENPYHGCSTEFEMLSRIVSESPPRLTIEEGFSSAFCDFVSLCLTKEVERRPKYRELLMHEWIVRYENANVDVAGWYQVVVQNSSN